MTYRFCSHQYLPLRVIFVKLYLEQPIDWEPTDNIFGEEFYYSKYSKDDPVSEPFCIVLLLRTLQGLHRLVSRINKTNYVTY